MESGVITWGEKGTQIIKVDQVILLVNVVKMENGDYSSLT